MANVKISDSDLSWVSSSTKLKISKKLSETASKSWNEINFFLFLRFCPFRKTYGRQNSLTLEDINLDQFLKISNYEETIKQLDIYYGIVKRQLLQNQSEITGLFPVLSTDKEVKMCSRSTSQKRFFKQNLFF